jgi:hypothetical protein
MLRLQMLRLYRREYFHALRNNLNPSAAAEQALTRVKDQFLNDPVSALPDIDRQEQWGAILDVLIEFNILLKDIPIDKSKLPKKPPIEAINDPTLKKE